VGLFKAPLNKVTLTVRGRDCTSKFCKWRRWLRRYPYKALYRLEWLSPGTACLLASLLSALLLACRRRVSEVFASTAKQLLFSEITIAAVWAGILMNYCGPRRRLAWRSPPRHTVSVFSSLLGWLGVFLTGSDTSANALFGNLQVVTAGRLNLNAVLMAASNSSGGVMGKMISLQSIAVAARPPAWRPPRRRSCSASRCATASCWPARSGWLRSSTRM